MSTHRVWIDDGKHNRVEDGEGFDEPSARDAVEAWAAKRYSALQHVDPGMVLVLTPRGTLERWSVRVKVDLVAQYDGVATEDRSTPE